MPLIFIAILLAAEANATTYTVSGNFYDFLLNFNSINEAMSNADEGDRILVKSGIYFESLNITKKLTLVGVDAGKGMPVIDAENTGSAITISADGVRLEGFNITDSGSSRFDDSGIRVLSNNNYIKGNTISNSSVGIYVGSFSGNTITGNTARYDDVGIFLDGTFNSTLRDNALSNNRLFGICIDRAVKNVLYRNTAWRNKYCAVFMNNSDQNTLSDNVDTESDYYSILLSNSSRNIVRGSNISSTYFSAIGLEYSEDNVISDCNISKSYDGIYLGKSSNGNTLVRNILHNNPCGLYIEDSSRIKVYLNSFIDNDESVHLDNCTLSHWNSTAPLAYQYRGSAFLSYLGNFWSDYSKSGNYDGGVGKVPYNAEGLTDRHPLAAPAENFHAEEC